MDEIKSSRSNYYGRSWYPQWTKFIYKVTANRGAAHYGFELHGYLVTSLTTNRKCNKLTADMGWLFISL